MLCVGIGYIIVKQGLFVPASAKGVSILAIVSRASRYRPQNCLVTEHWSTRTHILVNGDRIHPREHFRFWITSHRGHTLSDIGRIAGLVRQRILLRAYGLPLGYPGREC